MDVVTPTDYKVKDGRMQGVKITKAIVYGNTSHLLPTDQRANGHTHAWTLYLRPYLDEDLSAYIRKVTFKLHDSYAQPTRVIMEPPYEVNETGWGQFEAVIRIFFVDSAERPVNIHHIIRLFSADNEESSDLIVSEMYDELVFAQPSLLMYEALMKGEGPPKALPLKHAIDYESKKQECLTAIQEANALVKREVAVSKEKLEKVRSQIDQLRKRSEAVS